MLFARPLRRDIRVALRVIVVEKRDFALHVRSTGRTRLTVRGDRRIFDTYCASKYLLRRKITEVHEIYVDATPGRTAVSNLPSKLQQSALD